MDIVTPAEKILLSLGIKSPKDIDLETIAWTLGAAVQYEPLDGCEALIIGSDQPPFLSPGIKLGMGGVTVG